MYCPKAIRAKKEIPVLQVRRVRPAQPARLVLPALQARKANRAFRGRRAKWVRRGRKVLPVQQERMANPPTRLPQKQDTPGRKPHLTRRWRMCPAISQARPTPTK